VPVTRPQNGMEQGLLTELRVLADLEFSRKGDRVLVRCGQVRGLRDGSPPVGSGGKAPAGGLGMEAGAFS